MERKLQSVGAQQSDYFQHLVENGGIEDAIEPLAKQGFFSGDVTVFDRHEFDRMKVEEKNQRRMEGPNSLTGRHNGRFLKDGNPR